MEMLQQGVNALTTIAFFLPLIFFSIMAFWKQNHVLFLITAAIALITGLETPDIMNGEYATSWLSMTIGITLIYIYAPACIGWVINIMLWKKPGIEG